MVMALKWIFSRRIFLFRDEEALYMPKSQILWLQEGDSNTQLFHKVVSAKQKSQALTLLSDDEGNIY